MTLWGCERELEEQANPSDFDALKFKNELLAGDVDGFLTRLKALFASLPYPQGKLNEHYYQSIFYLVFTLVGQYIKVEEHSAKGRSDAVVETDSAVYGFEFKLASDGGDTSDTVVDEALAQIDNRGYLLPYAASGKELVKVGVQFDPEERGITNWKILVDRKTQASTL
jgi:hypothetical protein